jgi:hypothetical protein
MSKELVDQTISILHCPHHPCRRNLSHLSVPAAFPGSAAVGNAVAPVTEQCEKTGIKPTNKWDSRQKVREISPTMFIIAVIAIS